jgi:hypothetical protein
LREGMHVARLCARAQLRAQFRVGALGHLSAVGAH